MRRYLVLISYAFLVVAQAGHGQSDERFPPWFPKWKYEDWKDDPNLRPLTYFVPQKPKPMLWGQYMPAILQGGAIFQMMTQDEAAQEVWKNHEKDFQYTVTGPTTGWIEDGKDLSKSKPVPRMYPTLDREEHFGEGWKIGILKADYSKDSGFPWNHGHFCGIAVNISKGRVLYFAERW